MEELEEVFLEKKPRVTASLIWDSVKSIADFMKNHFREYFSTALTFSIVAVIICLIIGMLNSVRLMNDMTEFYGNNESWTNLYYLSFYLHVQTTSKYVGIVGISLFAIALKKHNENKDSLNFSLKEVFLNQSQTVLKAFSIGFIFILIFNAIFYKNLFDFGAGGVGFIEVGEFSSDGYRAFTSWVEQIFNFIKSMIPFAVGVLIYYFGTTEKAKLSNLSLMKMVLATLVICFAFDAVFVMVFSQIQNSLVILLTTIIKSKTVLPVISWGIYTPVLAFFVLLFSAAFIYPVELAISRSYSEEESKELTK